MIAKNDDVVGLLKLINILSHQYTANQSLAESIDNAVLKLMKYYQQGEEDSVSEHIKNIKDLCQVLEHYRGWFMNDQMLIDIKKKKYKDTGVTVKSDGEYRKIVRNKAAALRALKSARNKGALRDIRRKYFSTKKTGTRTA